MKTKTSFDGSTIFAMILAVVAELVTFIGFI